jgi:hypothetical protein
MSGAVEKKQVPAGKVRKSDAQEIPAKRVLNDFAAAYKSPSNSKTIKIQYSGNVRTFSESRHGGQVPVQAHGVVLTVRINDCGIQVREAWEAYYYKLENEWIFQEIRQIKSTQLTKPTITLPTISNTEMKKLISDSFGKTYQGVTVQDITILDNKGYWNLCTPQHRIVSKITIRMEDDIRNVITGYECLVASILAQREGTWEHITSSCVYKGKEIEKCHLGTFCLKTSTASSIPAISDNEALDLLKSSFEKEYFLMKNNVMVEKFSLIKYLANEDYGTKIPCIVNAIFVIDENKEESINEGETKKRRLKMVRAVYECVVYGYLKYDLLDKKWEGFIESCCASENERCRWSCSSPVKGCRRLGEK